MDELIDYYQELGLEQTCDTQEIKDKFKKLALLYHPDKQATQDDTKFKIIERAYNTLSNKEVRKIYDSQLILKKSSGYYVKEIICLSYFRPDSLCQNFQYQCSCGDYYDLDKNNFQQLELLFRNKVLSSIVQQCQTCSSTIKIIE